MATYIHTPYGLINRETGKMEPFTRDAPPVLPRILRGDEQPPLVSMADGKVYTSKAAMRASYKAANNPQGVNYVELGNEPRAKAAPKPKPDRAAIKEAVQRAEATLRTRGEWA